MELQALISNSEGSTGAVVSHSSHGISRLVKGSPAENYGLKKGDIIVEVDGVKGHEKLIGEPYTYANVSVLRGKELIKVKVFRLPTQMIYGRTRITQTIKVEETLLIP